MVCISNITNMFGQNVTVPGNCGQVIANAVDPSSPAMSAGMLVAFGMFIVLMVVLICIALFGNPFSNFFTNRRNVSINIGVGKVKSDTFNINKSKRFAGVEIECKNNDLDDNCFIASELKDFNFSQGTDGSLGSGGVEFRSRPAQGDKLFNIVDKFTNELNTKKYYVDEDCGCHIHLEVVNKKGEVDFDMLKKIYIFYNKNERHFFNMLAKSRQDTGYCEKFDKIFDCDLDEVITARDATAFKRVLYDGYLPSTTTRDSGKRYCWANFDSIFYRGTLEIRSHSGTINGQKIKNWVDIHCRVLDMLEKTSLSKIIDMPNTKEQFLRLFPSKLQDYIQLRWKKFGFYDRDEETFEVKHIISKGSINKKDKGRVAKYATLVTEEDEDEY